MDQTAGERASGILTGHPLLTVPAAESELRAPVPLVDDETDSPSGLRRGIDDRVVSFDWRQAVGLVLMSLGVLALALAWWGVSGTTRVDHQLPYFLSGGLGGGALIGLGLGAFISYEHFRDRRTLVALRESMETLERDLKCEIGALSAKVAALCDELSDRTGAAQGR